jgi:hypothetical protein
MGIETLTAPRDLPRAAIREAVAWFRIESLAPILSRLLPCRVTASAVFERALGLGLLRLPTDGAPPRLTAERASRLLLAGYRLPALAAVGAPAAAREHLAGGRHVFLIGDDGEAEVVPLHDSAWDSAARPMVVAARSWDDLPAAEPRFFGGTREKDGSYHWDAADCDTDAVGRILRLW